MRVALGDVVAGQAQEVVVECDAVRKRLAARVLELALVPEGDRGLLDDLAWDRIRDVISASHLVGARPFCCVLGIRLVGVLPAHDVDGMVLRQQRLAEALNVESAQRRRVPMRHDFGHLVVAGIVPEDHVTDRNFGDRPAAAACHDPCRGSHASRTPVVVQVGLVVLQRELHRRDTGRGLNGHASPPVRPFRRRGRCRARARARPR